MRWKSKTYIHRSIISVTSVKNCCSTWDSNPALQHRSQVPSRTLHGGFHVEGSDKTEWYVPYKNIEPFRSFLRTIIFHKRLRLFSSSQVPLFSSFWLRVIDVLKNGCYEEGSFSRMIVLKNDCSQERTIVFHKQWSLGYVKLVCGKANCNISQPFSFVTNDGSSRTMVRHERSFFTKDWDGSQVLLFSCF